MATRKDEEQERNLYAEAFLNQYNILLMIFAFAASLILGSVFPAIVMAGVELIYMIFVPDSALFKRYVEAKYAAEDEEKRQQALEERLRRLHIQQRNRYETRAGLVHQTKDNMRRQQADAMHASMILKLDEEVVATKDLL